VDRIERLSSRVAYRNNWMTLHEDTIRRPDGSEGIYAVVDKPTFALVIPRDGDRFQLVEQFRYPIGKRSWEFPQGTAPGQVEMDGLELAGHELREETGLTAGTMTTLGFIDIAPGMSSQRGQVFVATDLTEGVPEREHEEQDMRSGWFSRADMEQMMRDGVLTDAQTLAAWALYLLHEPRTGNV
jgi:8-oxo-dGTP pyrophosphatase MutT (NUDIX family)